VLDQLPYEQQATFVLFELEQMSMADPPTRGSMRPGASSTASAAS
jgi:hypothetical protein